MCLCVAGLGEFLLLCTANSCALSAAAAAAAAAGTGAPAVVPYQPAQASWLFDWNMLLLFIARWNSSSFDTESVVVSPSYWQVRSKGRAAGGVDARPQKVLSFRPPTGRCVQFRHPSGVRCVWGAGVWRWAAIGRQAANSRVDRARGGGGGSAWQAKAVYRSSLFKSP